MKIKTYIAPTMSEAMDLIRRELGENAIIVSTQRLGAGGGVRLTAAIEDDVFKESEDFLFDEEEPESELCETVRKTLEYHALPPSLIERILMYVQESKKKDALVAFASALDTVFLFHPLPDEKGCAYMLVGAPGSGKTVTTAKLATRACLSNKKVGIIAADSVRAGAVEQLVAFTNILNVTLLKARSAENLRSHLKTLRRSCDTILIDMPGLNPFSDDDMNYLSDYAEASNAVPVLITPAGVDPYESAEAAEAFAQAGATHLLATKLDAARRFGGVLAAAKAGRLTITEASVSANVTRGLSPVNAVSLARLLLNSTDEAAENKE